MFSKTSSHLLQLFRSMLKCWLAVKLQKCFVDRKTTPDFPSAWGWVDNDWIFIFWQTCPLKQQRACSSHIHTNVILIIVNYPWLASHTLGPNFEKKNKKNRLLPFIHRQMDEVNIIFLDCNSNGISYKVPLNLCVASMYMCHNDRDLVLTSAVFVSFSTLMSNSSTSTTTDHSS